MPKSEIETAHPVDVVVGGHIRNRRIKLGMTQKQVAEAADVTFQQLQKYEKGVNRVAASKLFEIAKHLRVPIGYFFQGIEDNGTEFDVDQRLIHTMLGDPAAADFLRAYVSLDNAQRQSLHQLVQNFSPKV